jgi:hypothetical protein
LWKIPELNIPAGLKIFVRNGTHHRDNIVINCIACHLSS